MKAIILAAGKGTRLHGPAGKPKCLLEVGGVTLLRRQIDNLRSLNIESIVVVVGCAAERIRRDYGHEVAFVENTEFARTSSLYSLSLAHDYLREGFVVLNADVLLHPRLLSNLINSPKQDALLISDQSHQSLGYEEMKVKVRNGLVVDMSKDMNPLYADGENVGIVKFSATGAELLLEYMNRLIVSGAVEDSVARVFSEFARHHQLHAVSTCGLPWIEIDFPEDYQRAISEVWPKIESDTLSRNEVLDPMLFLA
jgi:L-glutamine-phosphate cytidylyltransferase